MTWTAGRTSSAQLRWIGPRELAGIIVEPLLQGAGGMHVYDVACLRVMREVADEHGLPLVFDEIATGFGRTGTFFAAEAAGVVPDIMCVGKALTGGYLSLAAVLCSREVARGLSASESGVLMHGPTYMGNPLACAVALASLDLLESSGWAANVARVGAGLSELASLSGLPGRGRRADASAPWASSSSTTPSTSSRRPTLRSRRACGCGRSAT